MDARGRQFRVQITAGVDTEYAGYTPHAGSLLQYWEAIDTRTGLRDASSSACDRDSTELEGPDGNRSIWDLASVGPAVALRQKPETPRGQQCESYGTDVSD